jgi:DNA-binding NarL/FixJ family response regulator
MSKMGTEQVGDKNPFFNKKHSKDSKKLMSESHKANRNAGVYVASDIAKRTFTPEKEAEIANEYAANDITIKEMMKKYQCGSSAIFRILDVYGVRKGTIKNHKQSKQKREQILALHHDGFCQKDIAEQLSISVCSVSKYLVKEGIKSFRWKK